MPNHFEVELDIATRLEAFFAFLDWLSSDVEDPLFIRIDFNIAARCHARAVQ